MVTVVYFTKNDNPVVYIKHNRKMLARGLYDFSSDTFYVDKIKNITKSKDKLYKELRG